MAFSLSNIFTKLKPATREVVNKAVGIDIGSASVKVVELENTERALLLKTYGELQLGPYAGKDLGEVVQLDNKKYTEAVIDVMREASVGSRTGSLAMSLASSFMTVVPMVLAEGEDISTRIPVEARKFVPIPLNDVTLDWTELPNGAKTNTKEVMLAAIENKSLAEYQQLLAAVGMSGQSVEIEAFCLVRALWKHTDTTLAIIDIGGRTSKLYIVRGGILERLHRVPGGGADITRRISQTLGVSFAEAENIKRSVTKDDEHFGIVRESTIAVTSGPLSEFKRILSQYEARVGGQIGRIALSGGVVTTAQFLAYAQDAMAVPVEIGNAFSKVAYPAFMEDTLMSISPLFGVSMGAALKKFQ